ncbi:ABC transporter ATP-binding protein [Agrobacterium tumefaciens]|uniref:ABC transporter ATP-binding protein n=1 Tax=Agrobacterium tumefaciens TaxID=358 RepID=UPI00080FC3B6|nr:ABC transporter ATP-binding protein [Agrobacterium tumefaciens]
MTGNREVAFGPLSRIYAEDLKTSWRSIIFLLLTILLGSLLTTVGPLVFSRLIDDMPDAPLKWMLGFSLYAALTALATGIQRSTQYMSVIHSERLEYVATTRFFERIVHKHPSFFNDHNPAEIQSAQTRGASAASMIMQIGLIYFVPGIATFLFSTLLLGAILSVDLVAIVILYGAAFISLTLASNRLTSPFLEKAIEAGQENAGFVGNAIGMIEPLRHTGSTAWMKRRFADNAGVIYRNWRVYSLRRIGFVFTISLALTAQMIIGFYLLLPRYEAGDLSIGDIVLFNTLLLQLNMPFELIGQSISEAIRSFAHFAPYARMWSAPEEEEPPHVNRLRLSGKEIEFDHVGFRYENGRGVEGVSFTAAPGRLTFIIGETGSGKSTLFRLLQKTMAPQSGRITIDGIDLTAIDREDWFAAAGIVPQEVQLLNDTLRSNIVLGRVLDEERLRRSAERAAILDRIEAMPEGFDTVVGERGLKLSGGERQRVAIARALYGEPSILLLDEASSALDEETEREIMDQLRRVDSDITIIAITHRQSSIRTGDQVIALPSVIINESHSEITAPNP